MTTAPTPHPVDFTPHPHLTTCPWLVEVPNGNPEPATYADCFDTVECGASVRALVDPATGEVDGWICENAHHHFEYGSRRGRIAEAHAAFIESHPSTHGGSA